MKREQEEISRKLHEDQQRVLKELEEAKRLAEVCLLSIQCWIPVYNRPFSSIPRKKNVKPRFAFLVLFSGSLTMTSCLQEEKRRILEEKRQRKAEKRRLREVEPEATPDMQTRKYNSAFPNLLPPSAAIYWQSFFDWCLTVFSDLYVCCLAVSRGAGASRRIGSAAASRRSRQTTSRGWHHLSFILIAKTPSCFIRLYRSKKSIICIVLTRCRVAGRATGAQTPESRAASTAQAA